MTTTTTAIGDRFRAGVDTEDLDAIVETFADDIELYSPVLADPFVGKETVTRLFGVLIDVFQDIDITDELRGGNKYVLSFTANVGAEPVRVVDLLTFDDDGLIREFVVTMRPLAGIEALAGAVAPHLETILGG